MTRPLRILLVASASCAVAWHAAAAQTSHSHIGAHVLTNTTDNTWGLGLQYSTPVGRHLEFYPSFDDYSRNYGVNTWDLNADIKYRASGHGYDWLYVGTGFNLRHQSVGPVVDDQGGWNVFTGIESIRGVVHPFGEMRLVLADRSRFQVQGGVNITIGR